MTVIPTLSPTEACAYDQVDGSDLAWCVAHQAGHRYNRLQWKGHVGQVLSTCRKEMLRLT